MKPVAWTFAILTLLVLSQPRPLAQTAKFRHLESIYADQQGKGFDHPQGVTCNAAGAVVVADTGNGRLVRFTFQNKTLAGGTAITVPELPSPAQISMDSAGRLYALDSRDHRIVRLSASAAVEATVSFAGAAPPTTIVPKSFAIGSNDALYVADVFSSRVLVVDSQGKVDRVLPFPRDVKFGSALAVDETNAVFLLDSIGRRIFSASSDGNAFAPLGGELTEAVATMPTAMTISKGTIFVLEGSGGRIVSLRRDGSPMARQLSAGRDDGELDQPSQMCINANDEVFIADRDNSRVQVFQLIR